MAINNDDIDALMETLQELLRKTVELKEGERDVNEDHLAAQKGYIKDEQGNYQKIDSEYKKRIDAEKKRADLENKVNQEIDKQYTKEQQRAIKEELLADQRADQAARDLKKREDAFQKELTAINNVVKGSIDITDAQKRVLAQWKTSEAYLTAQRADMFKKQAEAMGGIVASNGDLLKSNGKLLTTTVELTKAQQKQLEELKIAGAPGKAFGEMADRLNTTKAIMGEFSNKILDASKASMGATASYQLVTATFEGIVNATKVMTKSLYEGERGAKVGAKAVSEFADSITTAMKGIGAAMMFIPGLSIATRVFGGVIALLGVAAKTAAEANKVAAEQNDKLFDSFNKLSEAGLTTAAGMTGVFETVQTLGMTTAELEKFNEMLMTSAKDLKMFGGTTAAGAKEFSEVAGALTKSAEFGEKLAQMGVTADAQREHTLKYMAQQTRLGLMQDKTQKDLVRGAAAYIEELDKMAMLTGATRKEQEEAQNAVNAIEELRASMEDAAAKGDTVRQAELKKYYDLAVDLQQQGLTRGAGGVAKLGAAGGGPTDEASSAAYIQFSKALDAIKAGRSREEVLLEAAKGSKEQMRELAAAKAVGSDLSGLQTDKTGTNIDFYNRILKANEEATKQNMNLSEYLKKEQDAKTGADADKRTKDNVEAARLQQAAAQQLDSVVWTFNAAAKLNKEASDIFNKAVTKFNETVGAKPVAGGNIQTNVTGGNVTPTTVTPSTTVPARQAREYSQTALQNATAAREQAEKTTGRGSEETRNARLEEAKARLEAERLRRVEETTARNAARGLPAPVTRGMTPPVTPTQKTDQKQPTTPAPLTPAPLTPATQKTDKNTTVTPTQQTTTAPVAPVKQKTDQKQSTTTAPVAPVTQKTDKNIISTPTSNINQRKSEATNTNLKPTALVNSSTPTTNESTTTANATTPEDVMKLIKFQGDALGNKTHFDALDPAVKDNFINMIAEYGKPVQINAAMRDIAEQQKLWDEGTDTGNPNVRMRDGKPVAKPGNSRHNYGRALDLNSNQVADLASNGLLTKYGFNTIPNDPPHIEMARLGGVFTGPESGYPVMLHGKEAVLPENQLNAVKTLLDNVTKENLSSELPAVPTSINTTPTETDNKILMELYNIMDDKFSTMISLLSNSNDVQNELLKHSRV